MLNCIENLDFERIYNFFAENGPNPNPEVKAKFEQEIKEELDKIFTEAFDEAFCEACEKGYQEGYEEAYKNIDNIFEETTGYEMLKRLGKNVSE